MIFIVPCLFSAVEEWKWKRAERRRSRQAREEICADAGALAGMNSLQSEVRNAFWRGRQNQHAGRVRYPTSEASATHEQGRGAAKVVTAKPAKRRNRSTASFGFIFLTRLERRAYSENLREYPCSSVAEGRM